MRNPYGALPILDALTLGDVRQGKIRRSPFTSWRTPRSWVTRTGNPYGPFAADARHAG